MTKKKWFQILQAIAFIGVGIFLIFYFWNKLETEDQNKIFENFNKANYWYLLLSLVAGLGSYLLRTARWNLLIETVDKPARFSTAFWSLMNGYMVNLAIPRLGEVSRCAMLSQHSKTSFDKLIGTMLAERIFDLLTYFVIFIAAVVLFYNLLKDYLYDNMFSGLINKFENTPFIKLAIMLLCLCVAVYIIIRIFKKFKNIKFFIKVKEFFINLKNGFLSIFKLKRGGLFLFYTIMIWVFYLLMTYTVYFSLDITKGLPFSSSFVLLAFGTVSMIILPGGIGLYPIIVSEILLLYNIPLGDGCAIGWLSWGIQTLLALILGLLSFFILPLKKDDSKNESSEHITE